MKKATMLMFALMVGLSFATMTFADEKKEMKTETKTEKKDGKTKSETKTETKSETKK